jgi:hypothetical protein
MRKTHFLILVRVLILFSFIVGTLNVAAQESKNNIDKVYGYDPLLYNGMAYYFYPLPGTKGTQYLFDTFDTQGSVIVRGTQYTNLSLNLDVYNQKLVLKYNNSVGSPSLLEISTAWLQNFNIHGCTFEVVSTGDTTKEIFQVFGKGPSKVMYFQNKKFRADNLTALTDQFFSAVEKSRYVFTGNERKRYRNNRSFVKAFAPEQHDLIWKYIRKHKLTVQRSSDLEITELINYCNTLTGS